MLRRRRVAQDAKQIVQQAVNAELAANRDDQSHWRYLRSEAGGTSFIIVETEHGAIGRHVEENGGPASAGVLAEDDAHNPEVHPRSRDAEEAAANGAHDDKSAVELLNLMPQAFIWKVESETPETDDSLVSSRPELPSAGHGGAGDGRDERDDGRRSGSSIAFAR